MDISIFITIIPPILTAVFAYLVARKRNIVSERLNKAKIDADIQSQALTIVKGVMNDMRDELRREIDMLRKENEVLKLSVKDNQDKIATLSNQLDASDQLIAVLNSEIITLQSTIKVYEEELTRLRKDKV